MKKLSLALLLVAVLGLIAYSWSGSQAPPVLDEAYMAQLRQARLQKDQAFRSGTSSPVVGAQQATFAGLRYFPPAAEFRVAATLTRLPVLVPQAIAMSTGGPESYQRWGTAEFELAGKPQKLVLLQKAGDKQLFVPFTDPTNGRQTYEAGRYFDLALPPSEATEVTLDFNQAYNPYCAYNHDYSCPKPPADNRLTVPVTAGELAYRP